MSWSRVSGLVAGTVGTMLVATLGPAAPVAAAPTPAPLVENPVTYVDPFIGTAHGGNTWPGATRPFGMIAWSPTSTTGDQTSTGAANGYEYNVTTSPTADTTDAKYVSTFSHANELASPGRYTVGLDNGVRTDLAVSTRAGVADFAFPTGSAANLLFRTSNSLNGSENAEISIDPATRTVTGSVLTGGFCGRRGNGGGTNNPNRRSYYRLYFSAVFDRDFVRTGTWQNTTVTP